jgi:hypothetical protein
VGGRILVTLGWETLDSAGGHRPAHLALARRLRLRGCTALLRGECSGVEGQTPRSLLAAHPVPHAPCLTRPINVGRQSVRTA